MSTLTLRLDFPSGSWLGDVSRTHPDGTLRATETIAAVEGEVTALSVVGADRTATVEALREHDRVDRVEVVDREGTATRVRVVTAEPPPHVAAAREAGIPIKASVAVTNGRATLDVAGERSRLTAFGRRLTGEGVTVGIEASGADTEPVLTEAQRELVFAAVAAGYYDTPRGCTLTELAGARGLAKSTCSETLHRAESRVLRRFVAGECDGDDPVGGLDGGTATGDGFDSERERDRAESADVAAPGP